MLYCEVLPDWRKSYFHPYGEGTKRAAEKRPVGRPKKKAKTKPALSLGDHEDAVIIRTFFKLFVR